jgi:hypothetical protein
MRRIDWTNAKGLRFSWSHGNIKTGRMLTTKTSGNTCPPGCPFLGAGCYAETGPGIRTWRDLTQGSHGVNLADLCARIRAEKPGSLWRHNEAGDLPGIGSRIDGKALRAIVDANHGRKGYTYTHKPLTPHESTSHRGSESARVHDQPFGRFPGRCGSESRSRDRPGFRGSPDGRPGPWRQDSGWPDRGSLSGGKDPGQDMRRLWPMPAPGKSGNRRAPGPRCAQAHGFGNRVSMIRFLGDLAVAAGLILLILTLISIM